MFSNSRIFSAAPHKKELICMRKPTPVNLIVYRPRTEQEQTELARRIAGIHAETVLRQVQELSCPAEQKRELLDAVIKECTKEKMD